MRTAGTPLTRHLHPVAWWVWAIGLAVACSRTTNPLLLLLAVGVAAMVVAAKRGSSPWARAFRLYLVLGAFIIVVRVLLHVVVGYKLGETRLYTLPSVELPGITLLGPLYLEGLLAAAVEGLRLASLIACIGAANALANPKRLLRALPSSLHEIGTAVVISVTVAPQLAESVQRVRRARVLRGEGGTGLRSVGRVALPVLQDTLDRSLALASAMDSRGYGRRTPQPDGTRRVTAALTLTGLLGAGIGMYGLLDATAPRVIGLPMLLAGLGLAALGMRVGGRSVQRSVYRPDPWAIPEWLVAGSGLLAAVAVVVQSTRAPGTLVLPVSPLAAPALPTLAVLGVLLAALPALVAPDPPAPRRGATP
ncbi:energy-coupling factor transport system permease protein [Pedococcus dokdonensis]|uniref:Energy-coupling factor transport system permease protein n=1 Tax=Pedococcus dokdonensis TaxID=443156 RepID=A0A1H0QDF2_9MICO|nr:energy-coupling factor transporter transmembrane component T [Pedococcus dokdonensis]SDP15085.1 energy-coupling factor transport system permease protein [Pedococcus dokdonensis]